MPTATQDRPPAAPPSPSVVTPLPDRSLRGPIKGVTRIGAKAGIVAVGGTAALVVAIFYGISSSGSHPAATPAGGPAPQTLATGAPLIDDIPGAIPTAPARPRLATAAALPQTQAQAPAPAIALPAQPPAAAAPPVTAAPPIPLPPQVIPMAAPRAPRVVVPTPAQLAAQAAAQQRAAQRQQQPELERSARTAPIVVAVASPAAVPAPPQPAVAAAAAPAPNAVQPPASPYTLQTGSVIPATLITGIDSDAAGGVIAQVNQDVYDSKTGHFVLIPRGSKLIGSVQSQAVAGGNRVMVGWQRIIFPSGGSVDITGASASDGAGYAGLSGNVDTHRSNSFLRTALTSLIGIGSALLQPRMVVVGANPATVVMQQPTAAQQAAGNVGTQVAQTVSQQQASSGQRAPTISVQPGTVFTVMVGRDLVFAGPANG